MAQVVEHLPTKCKSPSSKPQYHEKETKKKEKKKMHFYKIDCYLEMINNGKLQIFISHQSSSYRNVRNVRMAGAKLLSSNAFIEIDNKAGLESLIIPGKIATVME
jgi:hypothetical protein